MEIEYLQEFVAVVDAGSISKAAVKLNLTQPALSRHMQALERTFGFELFSQRSPRVAPSPLGLLFYRDVQRLLIDYDELVENVGGYRKTRPMRLVVRHYTGHRPLDDALFMVRPRLAMALPNLDLVVGEIGTDSPIEAVREGVADVGLMILDRTADLPGLTRTVLFSEPLVLVVGKGHQLAEAERLSLRDIGDGITWLPKSPGIDHAYVTVRRVFSEVGATPTFTPIPWRDLGTFLQDATALKGGGFTLLKSQARHSLPIGAMRDLAVIEFAEQPTFDVCALTRTDDPNPAVAEFLTAMQAALDEMAVQAYWE